MRKLRSLTHKVLHEAERHLSQSCGVMARLISVHGPCKLVGRKSCPFHTLVTSIISQQLSAKAALTIKRRVMEVVPTFSPDSFLGVPVDALRNAGLSSAKAQYIRELARRISDGRLNFEKIIHQADEDVITVLTDLPGIGRWTAEMFLIFGLKRPDVLALGDAGLQRSARLLYGKTSKLKNVGQMWRPYRSVASWYLWRYLDVAR